MQKGSVNTKSKRPERKRHSLATRTIGAIATSCILLGMIAMGAGLVVYNSTLAKQYIRRANEITSNALMSVTHGADTIGLARQVMDIYNNLTEEQRLLTGTPEYSEFFSSIDKNTGSTYSILTHMLETFVASEDVDDVYIAMFDEKNDALVYIADPESRYRFMLGEWETLEHSEVEKFLNWNGIGELYDISVTERYGWLCTAGLPLYDENGELCAFVMTDVGADNILFTLFTYALQISLAIILATAIVTWVLTGYMRNKVITPINKIAEAANEYVKDKQAGIKTTNRFASLDIHASLELENLSTTMANMEKSLSENEEILLKANAEKQRIGVELSMANKIQASMLPTTFPAFPDRTEFDIFASMNPARMVGGDFYDFFLVDDDHLALVMADVSGKGIPAALFMMITKVIVQSCAMLGKSVAETLSKTNEALCNNNKTEMFVTLWMGIMEISTGKLTASNAGHEYPALLHNGKKFELYKDKHSLFIAGMADTKYTQYTIQMESGDKIFLYTDGVTEATNSKNKLFGTDRLIDALNIDPKQSPEDLLNTVSKAVDKFVGDAEQFDDITMMCFEYKGKKA